MTKRLNDTAGVQAMHPDTDVMNTYESRTVRKIENGYITTHSKHDSDGHSHSERFSIEHPDMKDASEMGRNGGAMKCAVDFLKKC